MLDNTTKKRIDTARDILVGKVPDPKSQVEQITIALIYKFMDDMDIESEELGGKRTFFQDDFRKYAWSNIFDPRMGGYEILDLYSEAIMKMNINPNIPQLFRDIFKNAYLPYRDPETLKSFLKIINEFEYDHSERLGDAFEYLLSVLGSQGEAGQFRTPRHIIDFMVEIIDPQKHETILDPACGTAGFLISSYKHILKHNSSTYKPEEDKKIFEEKDVSLSELTINSKKYNGDLLTPEQRNLLSQNIRGYDISPDMVRLSLVNMYLHGLHNPNIYEYDTLTSEDKWNEFADVILANPPFMSPKGGIRPHKKFSIQSSRSEVLFVNYMAEHLTPTGKCAVIVPEGIIFQGGTAYKSLRKMLVDNYLVGVISLPAGVFNPYSGVKTSILWLDWILAKKTDKILFIKVENDGFDLGAQRKPIKLNDLPQSAKAIQAYKNSLLSGTKFDAEGFSNVSLVGKAKISENGEYNLSGERYQNQIVFDSIFPIVELKEVAEVIAGQSPNGEFYNESGDGLPFYQGKSEFGTKYIGKPSKWTTQITKEAFKDDILMSVRAPVGPINFSTENICISRGLAAIKPNEKIKREFLFYILRSIEGNIKGNGGAVFDSISRNQIESIKIPLPPLKVQEEIVTEIESYQKIIDGARQIVENYKPKIEIDPEWEMVELGEITTLSTGGTPTSDRNEYYQNGNIKWLVSGDIHRNTIYDCKGRITELGMQNSNARFLPEKSVLIALNGQGKTRGTVALLKTKATCNQSLVAITPNNFDKLLSEYLLVVLRSMYLYIRNLTGDNQRSGLNMPIIRKIRIPLAPIDIQYQIAASIEKEQELVNASKQLIEIFEQKIKDRIAKVWGEKG